jgi:hypothetical protein
MPGTFDSLRQSRRLLLLDLPSSLQRLDLRFRLAHRRFVCGRVDRVEDFPFRNHVPRREPLVNAHQPPARPRHHRQYARRTDRPVPHHRRRFHDRLHRHDVHHRPPGFRLNARRHGSRLDHADHEHGPDGEYDHGQRKLNQTPESCHVFCEPA